MQLLGRRSSKANLDWETKEKAALRKKVTIVVEVRLGVTIGNVEPSVNIMEK